MTTRMNLRVLVVFAIVALPLLVVAGLLAVGAGRSQLREANGRRLTQTAELIAAGTDAFVFRRIIDATKLTRVPTVREAAAAAGQARYDEAQTQALDAAWQAGPGVPPSLEPMMNNAASRFLADLTSQDPIYREALLTDRYGRLAAASERTTDYYQADEDWWREAFGDGVRGRVFVSGVVYDESAQSDAIQIAVPVTAAKDGPIVGVLKVIADIRELAALVGGARIGDTGDARLVRRDGSLVLSRSTPGEPTVHFFAADALRKQLTALGEGQGSLYQLHFSAATSDGQERLFGVAASQLGSSYPNLDWLVVVSQAEGELFAPVDAQTRWVLLMLAIAGLTIILLAVVFSSWLAAPPVPDDIHLSVHPAVRRIDEPGTQ